MALEKRWADVGPVPFIANGGQFGQIEILSTAGLFVKQKVIIKSNTQQVLNLEIKQIIDANNLIVGPVSPDIKAVTNMTAFTTLDVSVLIAKEQTKVPVGPEKIFQAVYEHEPTVAIRSFLVDRYGAGFSIDNPIPVQLSDGNVNIGTVNAEVEVQLSHIDNFPDIGDIADSVRVGDGEETLEINPDGSINVNIVGSDEVGTIINNYNEIIAVPAATPSTIVSYTVPVGKSAVLDKVEYSGSNIGVYEILLNGSPIAKKRTWFNGTLDGEVNFKSSNSSGLPLVANDIISITVTHNRPFVGDFASRIQAVQL